MAEIHVERKPGVRPWMWLLLLVLLIVAAVAYLWYAGYIDLPGIGSTQTSLIESAGGFNGA